MLYEGTSCIGKLKNHIVKRFLETNSGKNPIVIINFATNEFGILGSLLASSLRNILQTKTKLR